MGYIRTKAYINQPILESEFTDPELIPFFNLKEMVANRAASLLWGRNVHIRRIDGDTEHKGLLRLKEILNKNNLQGLFYEAEKRLSINGVEYITCDYSFNDDMPILSMSNQIYPQGIAKQQATTSVAVIWKTELFDMITIPILEVWTKKYVRRQRYRGGEPIMPYLTDEDRSHINENLLPDRWNHDLGFLPVWQLKNKPNWGLVADADNTAVQYYQLMVNKITEAFYKELEKNQTRVMAALNEAELANLGKDGSGFQKIINDYIFYLGNKSDIMRDPINVIMGDPKIEAYVNGIRENINMYFNANGYSDIFNSGGGNVEQSSTQALSNKSLDMETTRNKRQQRIYLLNDILKGIIGIDEKFGKGDIFGDCEDYTFDIPENIPVSIDDTLRRIQTEVPLGTMSKKRAISLMNDIQEDEAQNMLEQIRDEQEIDMEIETSMLMEQQEMKFAENEGVKNNNQLDKGLPKK